MSKLFCKVGDLAVTVKAELPINVGNVVRVIGVGGYEKWSSYKTKIFVWKVEAASPDRPLVYEYPDGGIEKLLVGRIPDHYLRPIRPDELEQIHEDLLDLPIDLQAIENIEEVEYV